MAHFSINNRAYSFRPCCGELYPPSFACILHGFNNEFIVTPMYTKLFVLHTLQLLEVWRSGVRSWNIVPGITDVDLHAV